LEQTAETNSYVEKGGKKKNIIAILDNNNKTKKGVKNDNKY